MTHPIGHPYNTPPPANLAAPVLVIECGSCGAFHRLTYGGDCRNDAERFASLEDAAQRLGKPVCEAFEDGSRSGEIVTP